MLSSLWYFHSSKTYSHAIISLPKTDHRGFILGGEWVFWHGNMHAHVIVEVLQVSI